jgi:hypothetical protein
VPPLEGCVSINVDATLFAASKSMGWGAIFREHSRSFLSISRDDGSTGYEVNPNGGKGARFQKCYSGMIAYL